MSSPINIKEKQMHFLASELHEGMIVQTVTGWHEIEWVASSPTQVVIKWNKWTSPSTYDPDTIFLAKPSSVLVVL
jgi:hypothetical protein